MEKLMDHTLQKQNADLIDQVNKLTVLVEKLVSQAPTQLQEAKTPPQAPVQATIQTQQVTVNNGPVTNTAITNNTVNIIQPWDGENRIRVTAEMIAEAFTENTRLAEFCKMSDYEQTNPEGAGPYVLEALMDLTKRAHKDPMARNIYLSPKRADQVMVCLVDGSWEVRSLEEATRMMFDGVAMEIKRVVRSNEERGKLPFQIQGSASYVPMMYEDEQDRYVSMAKKPVSAHLTNTAPALK